MADTTLLIAFNGEAPADGFYGDLVAVKVEENTRTPNTVEMRLATRKDDNGAWVYLDDGMLTPFTRVSVKIGFVSGQGLAGELAAAASGISGGGDDGLEPVFDGFITSLDVNLGSNPNDAHVVVCGMDTSVLLSLEEKTATFKGMSDSQIVEGIVGAYDGLKVAADATAAVYQENNTTIAQRSSDIEFIRDRATLNGFEFYFETDKSTGKVVAHFRAPQLEGTPQPDLAIQFAGKSNLRSFSARMTAQRPLAVKAQQIDVKANNPNTGKADATKFTRLGARDDNDVVGSALANLVQPKDTQAQMLVLGTPTSNSGELQTLVQAVRDEAAWFISAEGEINSDAYRTVLRPHRLVQVKGAAKPFSGKYYVTRVVHELKGDGTYLQHFEARRNARDTEKTDKFGESSLGLPVTGG